MPLHQNVFLAQFPPKCVFGMLKVFSDEMLVQSKSFLIESSILSQLIKLPSFDLETQIPHGKNWIDQ